MIMRLFATVFLFSISLTVNAGLITTLVTADALSTNNTTKKILPISNQKPCFITIGQLSRSNSLEYYRTKRYINVNINYITKIVPITNDKYEVIGSELFLANDDLATTYYSNELVHKMIIGCNK